MLLYGHLETVASACKDLTFNHFFQSEFPLEIHFKGISLEIPLKEM